MLEQKQIERINSGFRVYDHVWPIYARLLGEPFLFDDKLVYFDGRILFINCFQLSDLTKETNVEEFLPTLLQRPQFRTAEAVELWGRIQSPPELIQFENNRFRRISHEPYEATACDATINLSEHGTFIRQNKDRRKLYAFKNKGLRTQVVRREHMTWRHRRLLETFAATHVLSPVTISFYLAIESVLQCEQMLLVEAWFAEELVGASLIAVPNADDLVVLFSHFDKSKPYRAGDAVKAQVIDYGLAKGIKTVHLGYSFTRSLKTHKEKWGARELLPPYRDVFYSRNPELDELITTQQFLWCQRISSQRSAASEILPTTSSSTASATPMPSTTA